MLGMLAYEFIGFIKMLKWIPLALLMALLGFWNATYVNVSLGAILSFSVFILVDNYSKSNYDTRFIMPVSSVGQVISKYLFFIASLIILGLISYGVNSIVKFALPGFQTITLKEYILLSYLQLGFGFFAITIMFYVGREKSERTMNVIIYLCFMVNIYAFTFNYNLSAYDLKAVSIFMLVIFILSFIFSYSSARQYERN